MSSLAIIGGGPAGLRAAEIASASGLDVTLYEAKRSVGRKFLIAGKGGFNITNNEALDHFVKRYSGPQQPEGIWDQLLGDFDNQMIRAWAARLDVGTFVASSGRVYPKALKAAPLLRAWLKRIKAQGSEVKVNHKLVDLSSDSGGKGFQLSFETADGHKAVQSNAVILALGGGSWPQTGSDGAWVSILSQQGVAISPLTSANSGWNIDWPEAIVAAHEATPLKNIHTWASAQPDDIAIGELMLTRYGFEGGPIYQLGPQLRAMSSPAISLDFKPTFTAERLIAKMESAKQNFLKEAQQRWKLSPTACAILDHYHGPFDSATQLAAATKACDIPLNSPRPIDEAISSAGGITWPELDSNLMIKKLPGLFVAGEMIDWEAPTGGYLMQGAFASGTRVGQAAVEFLKNQ